MSNEAFDLVVIGAGPGGYTAAIRASQLGLRTACIEKSPSLGGTCLNIGCIPSKALLDSSHHFYAARSSFAHHGIRFNKVEMDVAVMMKRKDEVVQALTRGVAGLFAKHKIESIKGTARLINPTTIEVTGEKGVQQVQARRIVIATGSAPVELKGLAFDGKRVLSSTEALSIPGVPRKLIVIGAGAVGLELGSVWSRLGAEVTVVEFADRVTPGMERDLSAPLQKALEKQGMKFRLRTGAEAVKVEGQGVRVTLASEGKRSEETADYVLVAVGRRAFADKLGADAIGVEVDKRGRIVVGKHFETRVPNVFAIGDVIAGPMLAHKASEEAVACVEHIVTGAGHVNYLAIPNVVYTHPEVAGVGMTEEEAKANGHEVRVGKFPFLASGRAKAMGETEGFVKAIGDAKTDRLLGLHIIGPGASELIAQAVIGIEMAASTEDIARVAAAHPTLAEAVKEACLAVDKRTLNL